MFFCDRSGSMQGKPFTALTEGMKAVAEIIFGEQDEYGSDGSLAEEEDRFDNVHVVYYDNRLYEKITKNKKEYLDKVNSEYASGSTDFINCFQHIEKCLN